MAISVGDVLPAAKLQKVGAEGPEVVDLNAWAANSKIAVFAVPGAFTETCSTVHVPSFIRNAEKFRAKGVAEIVCVSVNDIFVMDAWSRNTGAGAAGIHLLADGDSSFTKAMGMVFTAAPVGLINRSRRYAMLVEDGTITVLEIEASPGECSISGGESLLEKI
ncbi:MAG: peroxiredoxin [Rhodobacteraceae bacterium]|nr:peroxiredoxin [Paracoccaceae bacterium]